MRQIETRSLTATLEQNGFRMTPQREHVYRVLISKPDHPTADEVFMRAKKDMPEISMATVYNTLDALVASKLVRLVNHDRGATRFQIPTQTLPSAGGRPLLIISSVPSAWNC